MKDYYIVLSSVTSAQRLQKLLETRGIRSYFVHTPKAIADGGCGYSVIVSERYLKEALDSANEYGIAVRKVEAK